jgi:hypothetical protein
MDMQMPSIFHGVNIILFPCHPASPAQDEQSYICALSVVYVADAVSCNSGRDPK